MRLMRQLRVLDSRIEEDWIVNSIKVAFASSDLKQVDQHFGAAESFVIHAVDPQTSHLVEVVQFGPQSKDGNENKLAVKLAALEGCVAVYCQAVGGSAIQQLKARGVQPVKVAAGVQVAALLREVQTELHATPGGWLVHAQNAQQARSETRFDLMEAEGWEE